MSPLNVPVSTTIEAPDRRKQLFTIRCLTMGGAGMKRPRRCHFQYTRHSVKGRIHGTIEKLRQRETKPGRRPLLGITLQPYLNPVTPRPSDHIASRLKLSPRDTVGIGDAENDQTFLAVCACAVGVDNALDSVKARVDWVTRGAHGAGVVELIEGFEMGARGRCAINRASVDRTPATVRPR